MRGGRRVCVRVLLGRRLLRPKLHRDLPVVQPDGYRGQLQAQARADDLRGGELLRGDVHACGDVRRQWRVQSGLVGRLRGLPVRDLGVQDLLREQRRLCHWPHLQERRLLIACSL